MAVRVSLLAAALLVAVSCFHATASDPSLLQDFCVVDKMSKGTLSLTDGYFAHKVRVNGFPCKDANDAMVEDFFFSGLHMAGNTTNKQGSAVTPVNVAQIAALNTMGISLARIDYAPFGQNPPHTHPRGDVFVFPQGLIHFQFNYGTKNAVALAALSSQNPGVITVANSVFGSKPSIPDDILAKAFQVDKMTVDRIQAQF
ncbi:putative germin-like protein 2-2 isoform X4 [Panicum virgatum]|uniref:putative germin-like protein 2-2 isoform X4 n=1 Tax=Panicum virgatum TaxID=38727 RepID=UPI0019D591E6|nr:putative germin-like protein 2-2 isoform X4 [Panicum virgatum]